VGDGLRGLTQDEIWFGAKDSKDLAQRIWLKGFILIGQEWETRG
jgi:hypothetical protein